MAEGNTIEALTQRFNFFGKFVILKLMKLVVVIILLGVLAFLGTQGYSFLGRERGVWGEFEELRAKLERAQADQDKFRAELDYYLNPANLEKELRARFNYKRPGEKLLIIVPRNETTTE